MNPIKSLSSLFRRRAAAPMLLAALMTVAATPAPVYANPESERFTIPTDPSLSTADLNAHLTEMQNARSALYGKDTPIEQQNDALALLSAKAHHTSPAVAAHALSDLSSAIWIISNETVKQAAAAIIIDVIRNGALPTRLYMANNTLLMLETNEYHRPVLEALLTAPEAEVRAIAMRSLYTRVVFDDPQSLPSYKPLIEAAANDPAPDVRIASTDAWGQLAQRAGDPEAEDAADRLTKLMTDPNIAVRFSARQNLMNIALKRPAVLTRALDAGQDALNDPAPLQDPRLRPAIITGGLLNLYKAYPAEGPRIISMLTDAALNSQSPYNIEAGKTLCRIAEDTTDSAIQETAMRVIPALLTSAEGVPMAVRALTSIIASSDTLRADAADILINMPVYAEQLKALGRIGAERPELRTQILDTIEKSINDPGPAIRTAAAEGLHSLAQAPAGDDDRLHADFVQLFNAATDVRSANAAARGMLEVSFRAPHLLAQTLDVITARKDDTRSAVRESVVSSLAVLTTLLALPGANEPFATIKALAADGNMNVRATAIAAFATIAEKQPALKNEALLAISTMTGDSSTYVTGRITTEINRLRNHALAAHPIYIRILTQLRASRNSTAETIFNDRLRAESATLLPLRARLEADMLGAMFAPQTTLDFINEVIPLTGSVDAGTRLKATDMLGTAVQTHPATAATALPVLVTLAYDYEPEIRMAVARHIGTVAPGNSAAALTLPALGQLAADADLRVSSMAILALGRIAQADATLAGPIRDILRPLESTAPPALRSTIRKQIQGLGAPQP